MAQEKGNKRGRIAAIGIRKPLPAADSLDVHEGTGTWEIICIGSQNAILPMMEDNGIRRYGEGIH